MAAIVARVRKRSYVRRKDERRRHARRQLLNLVRMPQSLVFYVSGHGFGHASRDIEVINALLERRPDLEIHVRTYAPHWLFDLTVRGDVRYDQVDCDTGVVQRDTLNPDIEATVARARGGSTASSIARASAEAVALEEIGPSFVLATCPPLGFRGGRDSPEVPSVAVGNFTWDWIYDGYARWFGGAAWIPALIRDTHRFAEEAWRLPMHGGFEGFRHVVDLPFVADASRAAAGTRSDSRLGLGGPEAGRPGVVRRIRSRIRRH